MRLAVNLENADDLHEIGHYYYPTHQAIEFVKRLSSATIRGGVAYALEGPYGSGKSSLAAFALNQLSCRTSDFVPRPSLCLFKDNENPVEQINEAGGLIPIVLNGAFDRLASRILHAVSTIMDNSLPALSRYDLKSTVSSQNFQSVDEILLSSLDTLARVACKNGNAGVLIVIDEFGRHLDYMTDSPDQSDFRVLQGIAELTGRRTAPLSLVIIQHFDLDHYSTRVFGDKRQEWEKVRGRFRQTVLTNNETETAYIAGKAILKNFPLKKCRLKPYRQRSSKSLPRMLRDPYFLEAAATCRPLHPMTVVLLSRLARLLGQHDRTVVGWITSDLPTGFDAKCTDDGRRWIYPAALFDHFFGNTLCIPSNPIFSRRFAAIQGANERLGDDLNQEDRQLFQVLSLLSFCGGQGLIADKIAAIACLPPQFPFSRSIEKLLNKSLLVYRNFRREYVVWEGSDYDVIGRIDQEVASISIDMAREMNQRFHRPILAHRHYIETGNRRIAPLVWLNKEDLVLQPSTVPRVLVWLGTSSTDCSKYSSQDVRFYAGDVALEPHLKASIAIRRLINGDPELREDKTALREARLRLNYHEARISNYTEQVLCSSDSTWQLGPDQFSSLQEAVSEAMYRAYPHAFVLHIDMINRDRVSGAVSAALRRLIEALYLCPQEKNLGIRRFPAERIIYESFLKRNGLHRKCGNGKWSLVDNGTKVPKKLQYSLRVMRDLFINGETNTARTLDSVVEAMREPPFGQKGYPTLLLCILLLLIDRDRYEVYEDSKYLPHWGPQTLNRMIKSPKRFAISATPRAYVNEDFMKRYRNALTGEEEKSSDTSPVAVARASLKRHAQLTNYVQRTESVSKDARALRRSFLIAKSPSDLLFRIIPNAFGYSSLPVSDEETEKFMTKIRIARENLETAHDVLLSKFGDILVSEFNSSSLEQGRLQLISYAKGTMRDSRMYHGLERFTEAVLSNCENDDQVWLHNVIDAGLGIAAPLSSWTDAHVAQAEFVMRQTLIAIQHADRLLSGKAASRDKSPFVVFLPGLTTESMELTERKILSVLDAVPDDRRMSLIIKLARNCRDSK